MKQPPTPPQPPIPLPSSTPPPPRLPIPLQLPPVVQLAPLRVPQHIVRHLQPLEAPRRLLERCGVAGARVAVGVEAEGGLLEGGLDGVVVDCVWGRGVGVDVFWGRGVGAFGWV